MIKLSILMPTFNSSKTITKSITEILKIKTEFELLIADGGSTDTTISIIESFTDRRIKILSTNDNGIYDGINKILNYINGEYVQFVNSDDFINYEYIDHCINFLDNNHNYKYTYGTIMKGTKKIIPRNKSTIFEYQYMPFPHVSLILRSNIFLNITPFNTNYKISSDCDFVWKLKSMKILGFEIKENLAARVEPGGVSDGSNHLKENLLIAKSRNKNFLLRNLIYYLQLTKYKLC